MGAMRAGCFLGWGCVWIKPEAHLPPIYSSIHVCIMRSSRVLYVCGVLVVCLVRNDGCLGWGGG